MIRYLLTVLTLYWCAVVFFNWTPPLSAGADVGVPVTVASSRPTQPAALGSKSRPRHVGNSQITTDQSQNEPLHTETYVEVESPAVADSRSFRHHAASMAAPSTRTAATGTSPRVTVWNVTNPYLLRELGFTPGSNNLSQYLNLSSLGINSLSPEDLLPYAAACTLPIIIDVSNNSLSYLPPLVFASFNSNGCIWLAFNFSHNLLSDAMVNISDGSRFRGLSGFIIPASSNIYYQTGDLTYVDLSWNPLGNPPPDLLAYYSPSNIAVYLSHTGLRLFSSMGLGILYYFNYLDLSGNVDLNVTAMMDSSFLSAQPGGFVVLSGSSFGLVVRLSNCGLDSQDVMNLFSVVQFGNLVYLDLSFNEMTFPIYTSLASAPGPPQFTAISAATFSAMPQGYVVDFSSNKITTLITPAGITPELYFTSGVSYFEVPRSFIFDNNPLDNSQLQSPPPPAQNLITGPYWTPRSLFGMNQRQVDNTLLPPVFLGFGHNLDALTSNTVLSLRNCSIDVLPDGLFSYMNFGTLDLSGNNFGTTSDSIGPLSVYNASLMLETPSGYNIIDNSPVWDPSASVFVRAQPSQFANIILSNQRNMQYVPADLLQNITGIQSLALDNLNLSTPDSLGQAYFYPTVTVVSPINGTNLTMSTTKVDVAVPPILCGPFHNLGSPSAPVTISMRNSGLRSLPDKVFFNSVVGTLTLKGNRLGRWDTSFAVALAALQNQSASEQGIPSSNDYVLAADVNIGYPFSSNAFIGTTLGTVDLSGNGMALLPAYAFRSTNLQWLNLSFNNFSVYGGLQPFALAGLGSTLKPLNYIDLRWSSVKFLPAYFLAGTCLTQLLLQPSSSAAVPTGMDLSSPLSVDPLAFTFIGQEQFLLREANPDPTFSTLDPDCNSTCSDILAINEITNGEGITNFTTPLPVLCPCYISNYTYPLQSLDASRSRMHYGSQGLHSPILFKYSSIISLDLSHNDFSSDFSTILPGGSVAAFLSSSAATILPPLDFSLGVFKWINASDSNMVFMPLMTRMNQANGISISTFNLTINLSNNNFSTDASVYMDPFGLNQVELFFTNMSLQNCSIRRLGYGMSINATFNAQANQFDQLDFSHNSFDSSSQPVLLKFFRSISALVFNFSYSNLVDIPTLNETPLHDSSGGGGSAPSPSFNVRLYVFNHNNMVSFGRAIPGSRGMNPLASRVSLDYNFPFTLSLIDCNISFIPGGFLQGPVDPLVFTGYTAVAGLLLDNNPLGLAPNLNFTAVFTHAMLIQGATVSLRNCSLRTIPQHMFPVDLVVPPNLQLLDLSLNPLHRISGRAFENNFIVNLRLSQANLSSSSFSNTSFLYANLETLDMGNLDARCDYGPMEAAPIVLPSLYCNRFNPFPANVFGPSRPLFLSNLIIGGVVSMAQGIFGTDGLHLWNVTTYNTASITSHSSTLATFAQAGINDTLFGVVVELNFVRYSAPSFHIVTALTSPLPVSNIAALASAPTAPLILQISGNNFLPYSGLLPPPCSLEGCFYFPSALILALDSTLLDRSFLAAFGSTYTRAPPFSKSGPLSLSVVVPSNVSPFVMQARPIPWQQQMWSVSNQSVVSVDYSLLASDTLCDLLQTQSIRFDFRSPADIAAAYTVVINAQVFGASTPATTVATNSSASTSSSAPASQGPYMVPYSPLQSLPLNFFSCLSADNGGALTSLSTYYAFLTVSTNYLEFLTTPNLDVELDLNQLYNPALLQPLAGGMWDDLDPTATVHLPHGVAWNGLSRFCSAVTNYTCLPCAPGYYPLQATFLMESSVSDSKVSLPYCAACPPGASCNSTLISGSRPIKCSKGYYASNRAQASCDACPVGFFQPIIGANSPAACIPCLAGTYSNLPARTDKSACIACPAGSSSFVSGSAGCTFCPAGTYQNTTGQLNCLLCQANYYSPVIGSNSSANCLPCSATTPISPAGSTSADACTVPGCKPGLYRLAGSLHCDQLCSPGSFCSGNGVAQECEAGSYQPSQGQGACIPCISGYFGIDQGATSSSTCAPCPVGTYNPAPGSSVCLSCSSGTYGTTSAATSSSQCHPCISSSATTTYSATTSLCPVASGGSIALSVLQSTSLTMLNSFFNSTDTFQSYAPQRFGTSLRSASGVQSLSQDSVLTFYSATGNRTVDELALLPDPTATNLSDASWTALIVLCSILGVLPLLGFRHYPLSVKWLTYFDQFPQPVVSELRTGARLDYQYTRWGVAVGLSWIASSLLVSILLAESANFIISTSLLPAAVLGQSGSARTNLQLTLKTYSTVPVASVQQCMEGHAEQVGLSELITTQTYVLSDNKSCVIAINCQGCRLNGIARISISLPYIFQLYEYDLFYTSAIPYSWNRLSGVMSQLPQSLLDFEGLYRFSLLESFFQDSRSGASSQGFYSDPTNPDVPSTQDSGVEISFIAYQNTTSAPTDNTVTSDSVSQITFQFEKSDTVYYTSILPNQSFFQQLSNIFAVVMSILGLYESMFGMSETFLASKGLIREEDHWKVEGEQAPPPVAGGENAVIPVIVATPPPPVSPAAPEGAPAPSQPRVLNHVNGEVHQDQQQHLESAKKDEHNIASPSQSTDEHVNGIELMPVVSPNAVTVHVADVAPSSSSTASSTQEPAPTIATNLPSSTDATSSDTTAPVHAATPLFVSRQELSDAHPTHASSSSTVAPAPAPPVPVTQSSSSSNASAAAPVGQVVAPLPSGDAQQPPQEQQGAAVQPAIILTPVVPPYPAALRATKFISFKPGGRRR